MHWVHTTYWRPGPEGNNIQKTNVPALRLRFRCTGGAGRGGVGRGRVGQGPLD